MSEFKKVKVRRLMDFTPQELNKELKSTLNVEFDDGELIMNAHEVIVSRYLWETVKDFIMNKNMRMLKSFSINQHYNNGFYISTSMNKTLESMFKEVVVTYFEPLNTSEGIAEIWQKMQDTFNIIYNEVIFNNLQYTTSLNIDDLLEVQLEPELIEKMRQVDKIEADTDNIVTKRYVMDAQATLDKILRSKMHNKISKGYVSGNFSKDQVHQVLGPRGSITTLTNQIYGKPIGSSFTTGMYKTYEMAQESTTAGRSLMLSTTAISSSEYFARQTQLVTMAVEKVVDGDCCNGDYSKVKYLDWFVKPYSKNEAYEQKPDLPNLVGKYYYDPETKTEKKIEATDKHLEGTTIKLRVAFNCQLENPKHICARCFGAMFYNIPKHTNIGWYSSTTVTKDVSQKTLSTKHFTNSSTSLPIHISKNAVRDFYTKENDNSHVYLRQKVEEDNADGTKRLLYSNKKDFKLEIKVYKYSANGMGDIKPDINVKKFVIASVSYLEDLWLVKTNLKTGEVEEIKVDVTKGKCYGSFTADFLEYIQHAGYKLGEDDYYYINLKDWKYSKPIIHVNDVSFNYLMLVSTIKTILGGKNKEKDSGESLDIRTKEGLLEKLFNEINNKLDINIALIEVIVYAFSCYDYENGNYGLGRNSDVATTRSISDIISHTSMGGMYAWERHLKNMLDPYSFIMDNAREHILDVTITPNEALEEHGYI